MWMVRLVLCLFLALSGGLIPLTTAEACHRHRRHVQECCPCEEVNLIHPRMQVQAFTTVPAPNIVCKVYQTTGVAYPASLVAITLLDSKNVSIGSLGLLNSTDFGINLTAMPAIGTWTPTTQFQLDLLITIKYVYTPVGGGAQKTMTMQVGGGNTVNHRVNAVLP